MSSRQPFMERDYYSDPRRRLRSAIVRALGRPVRRLGFDLEVRSFYSPIPDVDSIDGAFWDRRSELPGLEIDLDGQLAFIDSHLASHLDEFRPPISPSGKRWDFHLLNGLYQAGDAEVLYAMIRHLKPSRVVELGAGFSTLVTAQAVRMNREEGAPCTFESYDPFASAPPRGAIDGLARIVPVAAEHVGHETFEQLKANDVLFIDSSHCVRAGGDVVHLICEVIPRLAPGVVVHLHDIFLPYEYPREWLARNHWYWGEQYLLQALLVGNPGALTKLSLHALFRERYQRLRAAIPSVSDAHPPHSFWITLADRTAS